MLQLKNCRSLHSPRSGVSSPYIPLSSSSLGRSSDPSSRSVSWRACKNARPQKLLWSIPSLSFLHKKLSCVIIGRKVPYNRIPPFGLQPFIVTRNQQGISDTDKMSPLSFLYLYLNHQYLFRYGSIYHHLTMIYLGQLAHHDSQNDHYWDVEGILFQFGAPGRKYISIKIQGSAKRRGC